MRDSLHSSSSKTAQTPVQTGTVEGQDEENAAITVEGVGASVVRYGLGGQDIGTGVGGTSSGELPKADPEGRYWVLAVATAAVVLGLSTWFSATAVRYARGRNVHAR